MPLKEIDFATLDYARLSAGQREAVMQEALRRGKACRAEALRAAYAAIGTWGRRTVAGLLAWRRDRAAARALRRLDDRLLKDIGIARSEIASVVALGKTDRTRQAARPARRAA
jgi:uncharacterized protein YjiS (DUF1127 family)